jgi:hypothetical protein
MAITDNNTPAFVDQNVGQQQQRPTMNQPVSGSGTSDQRWSFNNGTLFGAPISRGIGSEVYDKIKEKLIEQFKTANNDLEIAVIDLDNVNEPALAFSSIIIAIRNKKRAEVGVAYHLLILEGTGDPIQPIFESINNQQVKILRSTSDAADPILFGKAEAKVRKAFPNAGAYFSVDGTVIPASFNPDDKRAIHQIALNAGLSANTELEIHTPGFKDLNLASISNDSSLIVNLGFNRQQIPDAVGRPMRCDVQINFASRKNNQNTRNMSPNSGDREARVSEVCAYVDLAWNPVQQSNAYNVFAPQVPQQTQKYVANMVITNLTSNYSYTPASVLMAMATAMSLANDNNWVQAFRPNATNRNEIDMCDIGALNIEANLMNEANGYGTRIDTKEDTFKLQQLGQLINALIRPGVMVSLDCPEYGPQSWYLALFAAAAGGQAGAYNLIYEAAQSLSNGNFSKHFPNGAAMFANAASRIHMGTWVDKNGVKRDIRDIDYLAVCNLVGDRNPQVIREFSDTYLRMQYPEAIRLASRERMLVSLTQETAEFTGFAKRVTFSDGFMNALNRGIQETGLNVRVNTPLTGSDFNDQRGVANFSGSAIINPMQSFMNVGPAVMPGAMQNGYGYFSGGRW